MIRNRILKTLRSPIGWLKVAFLAASCAFLFHGMARLGLDRVWEIMGRADRFWIAVSVLFLALRFAIWSLKSYWMLERQHHLRYAIVLRLILAGAFLNLVTPSAKLGGGIFRAYYLHKHGPWSRASAYGWSLADQLTNALGVVLLFGILGVATVQFAPAPEMLTAIRLAGVAAISLVLLWLVLRPWLWHRWRRVRPSSWLDGWYRRRFGSTGFSGAEKIWLDFFSPLFASGTRASVFSVDILLSALSSAALYFASVAVLLALGENAQFLPVALVVMLAYGAGTFLGIVGGIGVTELLLFKFFPMVGIDEAAAAGGAVLQRALFYLFVLILGGWSLWSVGRKKEKITKPIELAGLS